MVELWPLLWRVLSDVAAPAFKPTCRPWNRDDFGDFARATLSALSFGLGDAKRNDGGSDADASSVASRDDELALLAATFPAELLALCGWDMAKNDDHVHCSMCDRTVAVPRCVDGASGTPARPAKRRRQGSASSTDGAEGAAATDGQADTGAGAGAGAGSGSGSAASDSGNGSNGADGDVSAFRKALAGAANSRARGFQCLTQHRWYCPWVSRSHESSTWHGTGACPGSRWCLTSVCVGVGRLHHRLSPAHRDRGQHRRCVGCRQRCDGPYHAAPDCQR